MKKIDMEKDIDSILEYYNGLSFEEQVDFVDKFRVSTRSLEDGSARLGAEIEDRKNTVYGLDLTEKSQAVIMGATSGVLAIVGAILSKKYGLKVPEGAIIGALWGVPASAIPQALYGFRPFTNLANYIKTKQLENTRYNEYDYYVARNKIILDLIGAKMEDTQVVEKPATILKFPEFTIDGDE